MTSDFITENNYVYLYIKWNPDYFDCSEIRKATGCTFSYYSSGFQKFLSILPYYTSNSKINMGQLRERSWSGNLYSSSLQMYLCFTYSTSFSGYGSSPTLKMNGRYTTNSGTITIDLSSHEIKLRICKTEDYLYTGMTACSIINSESKWYNASNFPYMTFYY